MFRSIVSLALYHDSILTSTRNPKNGANRVRIGYINSPDYERHVMVDIVIHEMGHVFGLKHEHQRPEHKLNLSPEGVFPLTPALR